MRIGKQFKVVLRPADLDEFGRKNIEIGFGCLRSGDRRLATIGDGAEYRCKLLFDGIPVTWLRE